MSGLILTRRKFFRLLAAPAIVSIANIMPIHVLAALNQGTFVGRFSQISTPLVGLDTGLFYDVFVYNDDGVMKLETAPAIGNFLLEDN